MGKVEVDVFVNESFSKDNLERIRDKVKEEVPGRWGGKVIEEITKRIVKHDRLTVSYKLIALLMLTPATIHQLRFHELNETINIQEKEDLETKLLRKFSIAELEARKTKNGLPFGGLNDYWENLKKQFIEGDQIWEYYIPHGPPEWAVSEGIALIRNNETIYSFETDFKF